MYNKRLFYLFLVANGLVHLSHCFSCESSCDIHADTLLEWGTYLNSHQFWSSRVDHIATCARLCVRMTKCESFNFELQSRNCELNTDVLERSPDRRVERHGTLYSDISKWPAAIDPDCYSKRRSSEPCNEDEVCVPTQLSDFLSSPRCLSAKPHCPSGWLMHKGACYLFSSSSKIWTHAREACREQSSHLVRIESESEQMFLMEELKRLILERPDLYMFWTDGNDLDEYGKYKWGYPGGSQMTQVFWGPGEPTSSWEHCVALYSHFEYYWVDLDCDESRHYICEK